MEAFVSPSMWEDPWKELEARYREKQQQQLAAKPSTAKATATHPAAGSLADRMTSALQVVHCSFPDGPMTSPEPGIKLCERASPMQAAIVFHELHLCELVLWK